MKKIYIASPYTYGDKLQMVKIQIDAWHILRDKGLIPIAPLLSHYLNQVKERPHSNWLEYDLEMLKMCDYVIRLRILDENKKEIPSTGADMEEDEAKKLGLPFYSFTNLEELNDFVKNTNF